MAASYPTSAKSFSTKATTNVIEAAHVNDLQDEVTAIETALLTGGIAHDLKPSTSGARDLGTSALLFRTAYLDTALILGAATTSGIRLDLETGVLAVREGDDSAYATLKALTLLTSGAGLSAINDDANANMTTGLTINQGAADNEIFALKSSDVAHGITGVTETDTYLTIQKASPSGGGPDIKGFSGNTIWGLGLHAVQTTADATKGTGGLGAVAINSALKSGTGVASLGANTNLVVVRDNGTTRFILDADGDSHQDVGTAWTNFDSHDDALVLDSLAYLVSRDDDPYKDAIRKGFGEALASMIPRHELERIKLVTFNEDGHHFLNMSKLTMLLTGAVRQIAGQMRQIEARIDRALPEAL